MEVSGPDTQKSELASSNERFAKMAQQLGHDVAFEKEAFIGALGKGVSWLGTKALSLGAKGGRLAGFGERTVARGAKMTDWARNTYGVTGKGALRYANPKFLMNRGYSRGLRALNNVDPRLARGAAKVFRGAPKEMHTFGLLSGGINAAFAEEGDRLGAFARGYGAGALGGIGWRAGGNLMRGAQNKMLQKMMSPDKFKALMKTKSLRLTAGKLKDGTPKYLPHQVAQGFGGKAKTLGARVGLGTLPLAAAFIGTEMMTPGGGDETMDMGGNGQYPQEYSGMSQNPYANYADPTARMGSGGGVGGSQFYQPPSYSGGQETGYGYGGGYTGGGRY